MTGPRRPTPAPDHHAPHIAALIQAGRTEQAAAAALSWAARAPSDAEAQHHASVTQHLLGRNDRALYYAQRAAGLEPSNPARHHSLARCLYLNLRPADALQAMDRAAHLAPRDPAILADYATMLGGQRRYTDALRVTEQALRHHPRAGALHMNKASILVSTGRCDEAYALATRIAQAVPTDLFSRSLRCLISNYMDLPATEVLAVHQDFGACLARARTPAVRPAPRAGPGRLRIAVVSADLRAHSVSFFLEPLLEHLDPARVQVHVYHTNLLEDAVTQRLRRHAARWWVRNNAPAEEIARAVAADACDVMIDLGGHTSPQGLIASAFRPAPLQISWLGYPNTTGAPDIAWRIVDSATDPPGAEALATERLLRLDPCFLCYRPPDDAPPAPPLPQGPVTFASFNSLQKINPHTASLWRRVLDAVPGARLLLKMTNVTEPALQAHVRDRLAAWGLTPDRTTVLLSMESPTDHLRAYAPVHAALDTFPYHGTTTTCEALWMGVPVVSLQGDRHAARVGHSLLQAAGLPELAAHTEDEFVQKAAAVATDSARLHDLRASLRERLRTSPLCDAPAFAARFTDALEHLWRQTQGGAA
ncbi:MAG: hypothetical protein U0637_11250 [Phycisphaerales bacterium]